MDNNKILETTIKVFKECEIQSFPITPLKILEHYGYRIFTYKELKERNTELYNLCIGYSEDAFCNKASKIIAYNDEKPIGRIRFSLMHELGHHVLEHNGTSKNNEKEANAFASHILAPRMAIHYSKCKNANDVAHRFNISYEAAENAFDDYRRWHRHVVIYKMSAIDKVTYSHFYNAEKKCFVWSKKHCSFCRKPIFNSVDDHCEICTLPPARPAHSSVDIWDDNAKRLSALHLRWLYDH